MEMKKGDWKKGRRASEEWGKKMELRLGKGGKGKKCHKRKRANPSNFPERGRQTNATNSRAEARKGENRRRSQRVSTW